MYGKRAASVCIVGLGIAIGLGSTAVADSASSQAHEKRVASRISVGTANAMQAYAVAHGEANTALTNPYIEQKVTTPESVGVNPTKIPAGGF
jgi:cobalamin biosynthesis protein CbiD